MKIRLIRPCRCVPDEAHPDGILPIGFEIDHPDAWIHVHMGNAEPIDAEAEAYRQTPDEQAHAQHVFDRTAAGIHPDDFEEYDAGIMLGYNRDGSKIPGPNFIPEESSIDEMTLDG